MILELHRQGVSVSAIARQVGLDRKTVGTLPGTVTALHFATQSAGWAELAGSPPKLYATSDGGATWTRLKLP